MTGYKATNALIALILDKQFRVSAATNKKFTAGEMINFVQVDAQKLVFMMGYLSQVTTLPFLLLFCTFILFYYLSWSFFSAIAIFAVTFVVNFFTAKRASRLQKAFMKESDSRVKTTNESLNNIKMLKLYSWTNIFAETIKEKRAKELAVLWKRFENGRLIVTSLYFFPAMLTVVVFAAYIGSGHWLQLDTAFTVITLLNMIKDPLRTLPLFVGSFLEFTVSMKRIQAFMLVDEVNTTMTRHVDREETANSIEIRNGSNFHWGFEKKEEVKKVEAKSSLEA